MLLCSRLVTPVLPSSPFYPHKHYVEGRACGPAHPLLLGDSHAGSADEQN